MGCKMVGLVRYYTRWGATIRNFRMVGWLQNKEFLKKVGNRIGNPN